MANTRKIGLTFVQMLVGCCFGILAGGISLSLVSFAWRALQRVHLGGLLTALLLLISFLIVYGVTVAATAEGVRQMGRFVPRRASRRKVYEGSFLGACAGVALLTVTKADWLGTLEEWTGPIKLLGTLVYFAIVPLRLVMYLFPPLLVLLIAAPIGAAIGYNLPPPEENELETQDSEQQPANRKGRREKK